MLNKVHNFHNICLLATDDNLLISLCFAGSDFIPFQKEVWWIKWAHKWFTGVAFTSSPYKAYLKTAMSALILELWYTTHFLASHDCQTKAYLANTITTTTL